MRMLKLTFSVSIPITVLAGTFGKPPAIRSFHFKFSLSLRVPQVIIKSLPIDHIHFIMSFILITTFILLFSL